MKTIIFDIDGTLTNMWPIEKSVLLYMTGGKFGKAMEKIRLSGTSDTYKIFRKASGRKIGKEDYFKLYNKSFSVLLRKNKLPAPGRYSLVNWVIDNRSRYRFLYVTGGQKLETQYVLGCLGMAGVFDIDNSIDRTTCRFSKKTGIPFRKIQSGSNGCVLVSDNRTDREGAALVRIPFLLVRPATGGWKANLAKMIASTTKANTMTIRKNVPLSPLSTFRIGGRVEYFCEVRRLEELSEAVRFARAKKIPYRILGGGSNVVFPDGKLKGLLIKVSVGGIKREKNRITVGAAVLLADVIRTSIRAGLKGLETLSGIPGTVGGAVVGNAGAYGHSISEVVERVKIWDGKKTRELSKKECQFGYRESILKHKPYVVLGTTLKFRKGDAKKLGKISKRIIKTRERKYKPGIKCPGSFFKNVLVKNVSKKTLSKIDKSRIIEGKIPAGYLLEAVGAKGMRSGGIYIADFHGNLFVNSGRGKAEDVKKLSRILKNKVWRRFGVRLEEEVRYF